MNEKILEILIDNYKFIFNHYKLQNEGTEKKRYFLWVIQSALFIVWYKLDKYQLLRFYCIIIGFLISIALFFIMKRARESMFLIECLLREKECEINEILKANLYNVYDLNKKFIYENKQIIFPCTKEKINSEIIDNYWNFNLFYCWINSFIEAFFRNKKIKSERFFLDFFIPILFMITWIIIFFYSLYLCFNKY
jgi:hypothetical protein